MTVDPETKGALTKAPEGLLTVLAEGPYLPMRRLTKHLSTSRNTVNEWLRTFEAVAQVEVPTGPRKARLVNIYLLNVIGEARLAAKQNGITWQEALTEQLRLTGFNPPPEPIDELTALRDENAVLQQQLHDARVHFQQAKETIQSYAELLQDAREQIQTLNVALYTEPEDHADSVAPPLSPSPSQTPQPSTLPSSLGHRAALKLRRLMWSEPDPDSK